MYALPGCEATRLLHTRGFSRRALTLECTSVTNKNVPVIGFAAWSRKMAVNPDASYGRIVEHSYRAAAATPSNAFAVRWSPPPAGAEAFSSHSARSRGIQGPRA